MKKEKELTVKSVNSLLHLLFTHRLRNSRINYINGFF